MRPRWIQRPTRRRVALGALIVLLGTALVGGLVRVRVDTGAGSFLPVNDPTLALVEQKARDFGGDPVIVLLRFRTPRQFLIEKDQLFALLKAEGQLSKLPDVATVYGPATVLNQLAGAAQNFLAQIAGTRDGLRQAAEHAVTQGGRSPREVTAAGEAAAAQFDVLYAQLIVKSLPVGLPTLTNPRFGTALMFGRDGQVKPEWRFIVPAPDTVAVLVRPRQDLDQAGTQRLVAAIRSTVAGAGLATSSVTISGVPAVTAELTAEVTREAPLIGALVALVVLLRFLIVSAPGLGEQSRWRESRRRWLLFRLRPLLASLLGSAATLALSGWLGRPLSFAAVLLLPLLLGVGSSFPLYLATVRNRRRVLVMSVASAAAFLALALSPLPFVRDLGVALAAGILLTIGAAVALGARTERPESQYGAAGVVPTSRAPRRAVQIAVLSAAVAVALLGWVVLPRLSVQADPVQLARGLPALTDAARVESVLGASGEIAIELTGPDVVSPEALAWAHTARQMLSARLGDQLRPVVSASRLLDFLGPSPTPAQVSAALQLLPSYLSSSVVRPDHHVAMLVYGIRLQDLGTQVRMLGEVRATLPPPPAGYRADVVGLPVAAARGYQLLMDDRYPANLAGIVVAGLVLALGLRRRGDAARAVLAAVLATGWGLAGLWVLGVGLNPLTIALGSLVTVTGCEFAVLLSEAKRRSHRWLQRSVLYACLTSVLGYLVLVAARLWIVREFGLVLSGAVVLSYLAARLLLWLHPPTHRAPVSWRHQTAADSRGWMHLTARRSTTQSQ